MLMACLKKDLKRLYDYSGSKRRNVSALSVGFAIFNPRFLPVMLFRFSYALCRNKCRILAKFCSILNYCWFGLEIAMHCEIGPGLVLPHTIGTVIGANRIGENATILSGVVVGARSVDYSYQKNERPSIGNNVFLGAGAKILGGIEIGDNVVVGANSVVVKSIDGHQVVAGVPAKTIRNSEDLMVV